MKPQVSWWPTKALGMECPEILCKMLHVHFLEVRVEFPSDSQWLRDPQRQHKLRKVTHHEHKYQGILKRENKDQVSLLVKDFLSLTFPSRLPELASTF